MGLGTEARSVSSSKLSFPAPGLTGQLLGSCKDTVGSGLELEKLSSLEKKIEQLEKSETAAVEKVKFLETETERLHEDVKDIRDKLAKAENELAVANSELTLYVDKVKVMSSKEDELKKCINELEARKLRLEDIESERDVLQERLTQQQVTISGLQASLQSNRHKLGISSRDAMTLARVVVLCVKLEMAILHGLKTTGGSSHLGMAVFRNWKDLVSSGFGSPDSAGGLKNVTSDSGRGRAWLRSALNEQSLEKYFYILLGDNI